MQMGFNNDVPYKELTLHIQTEDHGLSSKKITSQVFFSGAILESKTISYEAEIASIEDPAARDERVRTIMKALHRKFFKRIQDGEYDAQLPLEGESDAASHLDVQSSSGAALETPEQMLADAGFEVAGEQAELGEEYEAKSRGETMSTGELEAGHPLEEMVDEIAVAAQQLGSQGFVQMGGVGSGSHIAVPEPPATAAPDAEGELRYGPTKAFRGLDTDHTDLAEALLAAVRGA